MKNCGPRKDLCSIDWWTEPQQESFKGVAVAEDIPSPENIQDPSNSGGLQQTSSESRFILANGCNLTRAQRDSIDALESKIRPEIPMYVTHINKTNMSDRFLVRFQYSSYMR
ncbi:hypothetical protein PR202_gb24105 [Eleusine coracana subsp. coracana]|uniref:Uncharacterized protein n=1 Tax=Eleusine coracana subsp. coracana TaxID=191504 RepID=A0AAV5FKN6_ELECO|nr:hypothetical protein PR202_gb24105 [Eleusine coracana subsp. coracana]